MISVRMRGGGGYSVQSPRHGPLMPLHPTCPCRIHRVATLSSLSVLIRHHRRCTRFSTCLRACQPAAPHRTARVRRPWWAVQWRRGPAVKRRRRSTSQPHTGRQLRIHLPAPPTMILLEDENALILSTLTSKFETPGPIDQAFTDFDGVAYYLESSKQGPLSLSMDIRCWKELEAAGAMDVLKREYGQWLLPTAKDGYSVSLEIDYAQVPQDEPSRAALVKSLSLLKRNAMAAPFERAFAFQKQLEPTLADPTAPVPAGSTDIMTISYRDDEAIYVVPGPDRVTVVFSTTFKEETDKIFGRVFLQEFVDARRQPSIQNAPQVLYSNREPPLEIRSIAGLSRGEDVGYVTFVLFPRHFANPDVAAATISRIQLFRDYLHYHIKASKAYMHSRMRARVSEFLKVLNRAKPETQERERKTATGRTFRRAV